MEPLWFQILGWLLTVIILIGNGLVIYLITTRRKIRTKTNWFVLSLAVADFGVGTTYAYHFAYEIHKNSAHHFTASIVHAIRVFFLCASMLSLCVLTLDRYVAIVKPMRYVTFITTKCVVLLISATWSVAFVGALIPCLTLYVATPGKSRNIMNKHFWVFLAIPTICACVLLLFATTRIFLIARRHARQNAALIAQLKFNHRIQHGRVFKPQEAAATKMVGVVVAVFLSCYLLFVVYHVLYMAGLYAEEDIHRVILLLELLNSAVNPVAYALFKREISKELKRLFCCGRQC